MRSNKSYSNVSFTKRVDYDGGAHRASRAAKGPLVCKHCGAVYDRRRWVMSADPRATVLRATAGKTICRACEMAAKGLVGGVLRLDGAFLKIHGPEIERLLMREADRAAEDNPLGRILSWDRSVPGRLTLTTTTEHLVERLGHALHRAFDGTVDYGFSHGNKFARATWRRD